MNFPTTVNGWGPVERDQSVGGFAFGLHGAPFGDGDLRSNLT